MATTSRSERNASDLLNEIIADIETFEVGTSEERMFQLCIERVSGKSENRKSYWRAYVQTDGRVRAFSKGKHKDPRNALRELDKTITGASR